MRSFLLIILSILAAYFIILSFSLERAVDEPRFHVSAPVPAEVDTSKCPVGKYGGRVLIGTLGDPKSFNPVVSSESSSSDVQGRMFSLSCY